MWVEIGAGHGEMTSQLARNAGKVIAIELDHRLAPRLREVTAPMGNVEVIESDVLAVDFGALGRAANFSVYGNLPYYITSPILHRLFEHADRIEAIHIVIQLEVAVRRSTARSRTLRGRARRTACSFQIRGTISDNRKDLTQSARRKATEGSENFKEPQGETHFPLFFAQNTYEAIRIVAHNPINSR